MLMNVKEIEKKDHQAEFLALPVTLELTVVVAPCSAMSPHAKYCYISF
jgi:hypothetical protein